MQVKDALTFAKEAFGVMKNDPKALYLLGRVLAHSGEPGRAKARRVLVCAFHRTERGQAYQNAIAKDKYCTDAVISLVRCTDVRMVDGVCRLDLQEDQPQAAQKRLEDQLEIMVGVSA